MPFKGFYRPFKSLLKVFEKSLKGLAKVFGKTFKRHFRGLLKLF